MKCFKTYDPLPHEPKEYRKKTTITAVQMDKDFAVITLEGTVKGKAGDWLAKGVKGELYPIAKEVFEATYEPADGIEMGIGIDPFNAWNALKRWVRDKNGGPILREDLLTKMHNIERGK